MNKQGFSLIELLAAITILAILTLMVTPAVMDIRQDVLNRTKASRMNLIKTAALDWASDNLNQVPSNVSHTYDPNDPHPTCDSDCACILVGELINRGYLSGSSNGGDVMTDPITDEELNDRLVCVRYDTNIVLPRNANEQERKLVAYLTE